MSQYAAWLIAALEGLGITRCHMLGHHTGGVIAIEMIGLVPARFASLAVIGSVYLTAEQRADYQSKYTDATITPDEEGSYLKLIARRGLRLSKASSRSKVCA